MSYQVIALLCRDRSHGKLGYQGSGNYECPVCGLTYHDNDYDNEDTGEMLSVYDAALVWRSKGKDEDYMFGYTEDELKNA